MLAIYLCGAVLVTAAATMFPAATPGPVLLAGLLWPVVVVGMVQMLLIRLVASVIRARAIPSSEDAAPAETWDRRTLVASGSRWSSELSRTE